MKKTRLEIILGGKDKLIIDASEKKKNGNNNFEKKDKKMHGKRKKN